MITNPLIHPVGRGALKGTAKLVQKEPEDTADMAEKLLETEKKGTE